MNLSNWFCQLLVWTALWLLAACSAPPEPLPVLRLGYAPHDHHGPLFVAAMNPGYFQEHGGIYLKEIRFREEYELIAADRPLARVLVEAGVGGEEQIRRLSEDQFDISFGGVPAMLELIDRGRPVRILAPVMAEGAALVLPNDAPANDWEGFLAQVRSRQQPLKIGYKSAVSVQNLIFEHALHESGISFSKGPDDGSAQVSLVNLNGAKHLIPAMENGLIDGFVVMQPFVALAQVKGSGKQVALLRDLPPEGHWHGYPCCALAANAQFVQNRPELAEALTILMLRAKRFITTHPEQSARQIAQWLDLPAAVEAHSLPTIDFSVDLNPAWHRGVDFWVQSMIQMGELSGKVREASRAGRLEALLYEQGLHDRAVRQAQ